MGRRAGSGARRLLDRWAALCVGHPRNPISSRLSGCTQSRSAGSCARSFTLAWCAAASAEEPDCSDLAPAKTVADRPGLPSCRNNREVGTIGDLSPGAAPPREFQESMGRTLYPAPIARTAHLSPAGSSAQNDRARDRQMCASAGARPLPCARQRSGRRRLVPRQSTSRDDARPDLIAGPLERAATTAPSRGCWSRLVQQGRSVGRTRRRSVPRLRACEQNARTAHPSRGGSSAQSDAALDRQIWRVRCRPSAVGWSR